MKMRLHRNERVVPFAAGEHVDMLAAIRPEDIVQYPDPDGVAELLAESTGAEPHELTLFAGAESAVRAVFDVAVEPGDAVVCLQPSYRGYVREAEAHRAELRRVAYRSLALDPEAVLAAVRDDARLVFLGNPDGLGRPMPAGLVREVLARTGGLVVVDEAYHHFGAPAMHDLIGRHPRLVVLRSFSKAWGMAGVRFGYSIAAPDVAGRLLRARLRNEVSGPALALVQWALRHPAARDAHVAEVARGARLLETALRTAGFEVVPTTANFVVARPPAGTSADEVRDLAGKAGVAIAVVAGDLVRISAGPPARMASIIGALTARPNPAVGS